MSRIATVTSFVEESQVATEKLVRIMLAAMPGSDQVTVTKGPTICGWAGRAGGGVYEGLGVCLALDGEIFNFHELIPTFDSNPKSDAELIAFLYERYGFAETLSRLNGDFAIILFDPAIDRLWLGRDRAGIKPLYFMMGEGWAACASQLSGLLAKPGIQPEINQRYTALVAASHYRTFDNAPNESPFANMNQVPAAHCVKINLTHGTVQCGRYWHLKDDLPPNLDEKSLAEEYRDLLKSAVSRRLRRAGRPAFTLSGGMDSSSVLCCAAEVSGRRQVAYSSVYYDPTYDERLEIQDVVDERVELWQTVELSNNIDVLSQVSRLVAIHNEPVATATWLSHDTVCQAVTDSGFESLFGGLGGDELNAGEYEYFPLFFSDLQAVGKTSLLKAEIAKWAEHHDHPIYRKNAKVASKMMERLAIAGSKGLCRPNLERQRTYLSALLPSYYELRGFEPVMEHPFASYLKNRAFQDLTRETTPCCLRAEDRQATHYGLRHYDPFLDHTLIEFMFRIPGEMKIRDGVTKHLLREAMRGILPEKTRTRVSKTGWNAPAHLWFTGKCLNDIRDLVASQKFKERGLYNQRFVQKIIDEHEKIVLSGLNTQENHMMFLWQLVNVEMWLNWIDAGCPQSKTH